jgi:hypothetical protein
MNKKIFKFFLYLLVFFIFSFFTYLFTPKFFSYTPNLIKKSLNKNSNINIKNISKISYKLFPSPRLRLFGDNIEIGENILEIESATVDIILKPLSIINHKTLDYNKFIITKGSATIEIKKINQLFNYIKNNEKKIIFKKNNIILLKEKTKLFEINNSVVKINTKNNNQQLSINGLFLNHKIFFILKNISDIKTKIVLKIPKLDVSANILLETNDNYNTYEGLANIEVLNNFFQFNLVKEKNIRMNKGFIRSSLTNTLFQGEMSFKPYFSFNLDIEPSTLNIDKLIFAVQQKYFLEDFNNSGIIKKINGSLNFKNLFEGSLIFKNRHVFFKNFKMGKNNQIFLNANVSQFGKKGKINFNLTTNIQNKKIGTRDLKILGHIIPSISKVTFEKIALNEEIFTEKKTKDYEKKFKKQVIDNSLSNIFNEKKINNFFKNF